MLTNAQIGVKPTANAPSLLQRFSSALCAWTHAFTARGTAPIPYLLTMQHNRRLFLPKPSLYDDALGELEVTVAAKTSSCASFSCGTAIQPGRIMPGQRPITRFLLAAGGMSSWGSRNIRTETGQQEGCRKVEIGFARNQEISTQPVWEVAGPEPEESR
jgi:hypothetical protein